MSALIKPEWTPRPKRFYGGQHEGKIAYDSRKDAMRAFHKRSRAWSKGLKPYHCTVCDMWHLGHPVKLQMGSGPQRLPQSSTGSGPF